MFGGAGDSEYHQYYPIFEREEDEFFPQSTGMNHQAYNHGRVSLEHGEGLVVDTGAVTCLSGMDYVNRQHRDAQRVGLSVEWQLLNKPKILSGVGDNTKRCTHQAQIPCMLDTGNTMLYNPTVIPGSPSPVPPLYSLDAMAWLNTFFGTANGLMAHVPKGKEDQIIWPEGTTFNQCHKARSGHWLLRVSNWKAATPQ